MFQFLVEKDIGKYLSSQPRRRELFDHVLFVAGILELVYECKPSLCSALGRLLFGGLANGKRQPDIEWGGFLSNCECCFRGSQDAKLDLRP